MAIRVLFLADRLVPRSNRSNEDTTCRPIVTSPSNISPNAGNMRHQITSFIQRIVPTKLFNVLNNCRRRVKHSLLKKRFAGKGVICPICNSEYRMFAPQGVKNRENALCPNCGSLERQRLLWLYFRDKNLLFKEDKIRVIHFAPEKMYYDKLSNMANVEYYPVDLFPERYDFKGKVEITKADITAIPFEDNYFDVILCNHVLEHISDDRSAMSELFRVMKKEKGWGVFQVPIDYNRENTYEDCSITNPNEREKAFGQYDHVRWYGRDYKARLESIGFKVKEDDFIKEFAEEDIFKYGLEKEEIIYKCSID